MVSHVSLRNRIHTHSHSQVSSVNMETGAIRVSKRAADVFSKGYMNYELVYENNTKLHSFLVNLSLSHRYTKIQTKP